MNNLTVLSAALEYIERNLQEDIRVGQVADVCFCSRSVLEKIFRCVSDLGVNEYITKRRMTVAARMLVNQRKDTVLKIAVACGYSSNEAFCRAFKRVWNCTPSQFRRRNGSFELFPRLCLPIQEGEAYMRERRKVDIGELYDLFHQRQVNWFVCCDIGNMTAINEVDRQAGDLAILETMNRMEQASGLEDVVFRIGGDEFVLLTCSEDSAYARAICDRLRGQNGKPIVFQGKPVPLRLHVGTVKFDGSQLQDAELYEKLHLAIRDSKC